MVLGGMSAALQWVAGTGGTTLQRLVDGVPLALGRTSAQVADVALSSKVLRAVDAFAKFFDDPENVVLALAAREAVYTAREAINEV